MFLAGAVVRFTIADNLKLSPDEFADLYFLNITATLIGYSNYGY